MPTYIFSSDGLTLGPRVNLRKPTNSRGWPVLGTFNQETNLHDWYRPLSAANTEADRNECGVYTVADGPPQPDNDADNTYQRVIANTGPGVFSFAWQHDPQAHADRIASELDDQQLQTAKARIQSIRADIAAMNNMNDAKQVLDDIVVAMDRILRNLV